MKDLTPISNRPSMPSRIMVVGRPLKGSAWRSIMTQFKLVLTAVRMTLLFLFVFSTVPGAAETGSLPGRENDYCGQKEPGSSPQPFAEGVVSTPGIEYSATFSPDIGEFYFTRLGPQYQAAIMVMKKEDRRWTIPKAASFSGVYNEGSPFVSPDGSRLFFSSQRPQEGSQTSKKDFDIWMVEKNGAAWGSPQSIGSAVNTGKDEMSPSVAADGDLYFHGDYGAGNDIYCATFENGRYAMPVRLGNAINTDHAEADAFTAPDESYILFSSWDREGGYGSGDIYVSFRNKDGSWEEAKNLGPEINSPAEENWPSVSPDGKFIFFTSTKRNGLPDIYWVESSILHRLLGRSR